MLAHLLPINEGYGSRTNIERLAKDLSGLAHRLSSKPYGQGVDSMDYPYLSSYLSVVCGRDVGPAALDLLPLHRLFLYSSPGCDIPVL